MQLARRLYFYFVAAVSLIALAIGLVNLLELMLTTISDAISGSDALAADSDAVRRNLSIYAAITIVALPIWFLHWLPAERGRHGADAEEERRSTARALYLTAALAGAFIAGTIAGVRLVQIATLRLTGAESGRVPGNGEQWVALATIAGTIFAYHGWVRLRDMRDGPLTGAADWLPRLYVYAAAATGITLAAYAIGDLLALLIEILTTDSTVLVGNDAWDSLLASGVARTVVGATIWLSHWEYSLWLTAAPDWRGERARSSALRRFYGYAIAFGAVLVTLLLITRIGDALLTESFGVERQGDQPFIKQLLDPLVRAIPFAVVWFYHRHQVLGEATRFREGARQATVRRVYVYAIALIGLGLTAYGVAGLSAVAIERLGAGASSVIVATGDPWRSEAASLAAMTLVGAAAWLWHWSQAQQWLRHDTAAERGATVRRVYLFISIAGGVVAVLTSLAIVIYRLFAELLGVEVTENLASEIGGPLAVLFVALAVLGYHTALLRADLGAHVETNADISTTIHLVVSGPAGEDETAIIDAIQRNLPAGYVVRSASGND